MIALDPITTVNVAAFKAVRLRALENTPLAFGSTYARESAFDDDEWLRRAVRMNGDKGIGYLAIDSGAPCGIAGCFLDPEDPTRAHLVSMWTAPEYRQRGVGRMLVEGVAAWAHSRGARTLLLMAVSNNQPAMFFYERMGFTRTGRTNPYPNDPALFEYEMHRALP